MMKMHGQTTLKYTGVSVSVSAPTVTHVIKELPVIYPDIYSLTLYLSVALHNPFHWDHLSDIST